MSTIAPPRAAPAPVHCVTTAAKEPRARLVFLDGLRGTAAALIVLHHLCSYGPIPKAACNLGGWADGLIYGLWDHGRLAVQVFFVLSGFVAVHTLPAGKFSAGQALGQFLNRYLRLALPAFVAIGLYLIVHEITAPWNIQPPLIDPFTWRHLLLQLVFLEDLTGHGSLFVAFWYLSIELQFSALFLATTWATRAITGNRAAESSRLGNRHSDFRADQLLLIVLGAAALGSVFVWNKTPEMDYSVFYFLGSYFVGILCGFIVTGRCSMLLYFGYSALVCLALVGGEFRPRPIAALLIGALVLRADQTGGMQCWLSGRVFQFFGKISYSLFLTHMPIAWLIMSFGYQLTGDRPAWALGWMLAAAAGSIAFAAIFHRHVETPLLAALRRRARSRAA